ncbi:MAG: hypothetical protein ACREC6_13290 [Hyphomicrobiaceae bacterium]
MFKIEKSKTGQRLIASEPLTAGDFPRIAEEIGRTPMKARKIGFVAARKAKAPETVETFWNGKETVNRARRGDWILTALTPDRHLLRDNDGNVNTYVVAARTFARLYKADTGENEYGTFFAAKGDIVKALLLSEGFDLIAPWGQRQTAPHGYLILNGKEVYGNQTETFSRTYEAVA